MRDIVMTYWLFSSNNIRNIEICYNHMIWGFWDRNAGEKQKKNWRSFIRKYNQIKPFDVAVFQIAKTGEIHAIGVIKETYYDDQTPIWDNEINLNKVTFPWRVSFSVIIFSKEAVIKRFIKIQDYIDGYGLGELEHHDFNEILKAFQKKFGMISIK
ncbi:hypothetical protein MJ_1369 [Methanocaldococcus jannaschii DSM 2661]|uniref:Uncharacterized protein MJ1369 n=2 Tax=Methanocaldococcus jannaschii TaxID=2190 RepID=Y1369_METJA|nr:RecName: Full=Uncharacterized protein MJ1369 [Methanocaldococcus jannaschii DSM 2661]AAB99386.1 hypothetical protein MJ_1369 [Methanocaldococcus jannaschii DSM 2661]